MLSRIRSLSTAVMSGRNQQLTFDDTVGSWERAQQVATGYDSSKIVNRVATATRAVLEGSAAFERDGVSFDEPDYRWPVAAGMLRSAARHGELRVIDFGGSLGSLYWQHKELFSGLSVTWTVVEQPAFVQAAEQMALAPLEFTTDLSAALSATKPHIAVVSSVLQYLEEPWQLVTTLSKSSVDSMIIDRTPMWSGAFDIPTVQEVPRHIYPGSYPAWILSSPRMTDAFRQWHTVARFPGIEPALKTRSGRAFTWSGFIAERTSP